jgi:AcrR family transcriptional regulator
LYAHFGSRQGILTAVALEGFQELGLALEKARKRVERGNTVESVAAAYLEFAASSPALYEVMFSLSLSVPFDDPATFGAAIRVFPTPGVVSRAELEVRGYIGTVLGQLPWYRRANQNQAISAQPSERAREGARRALHFP